MRDAGTEYQLGTGSSTNRIKWTSYCKNIAITLRYILEHFCIAIYCAIIYVTHSGEKGPLLAFSIFC